MFNQGFKKNFNSFLFIIVLFITSYLPAEEAEQQQEIPEVEKSKDSSATFFQFSFFSPLQIFPEEDNVYGLRLTFPYGENNNLSGLDLGICNSLHNLHGVSLAAFLSHRSD